VHKRRGTADRAQGIARGVVAERWHDPPASVGYRSEARSCFAQACELDLEGDRGEARGLSRYVAGRQACSLKLKHSGYSRQEAVSWPA
jgi:hypothetical protein